VPAWAATAAQVCLFRIPPRKPQAGRKASNTKELRGKPSPQCNCSTWDPSLDLKYEEFR